MMEPDMQLAQSDAQKRDRHMNKHTLTFLISPPSSRVKDRVHVLLSETGKWIWYVCMYSFIQSCSWWYFLAEEQTAQNSTRQDEKKCHKTKAKGLRFYLFAHKAEMLLF